MAEAKQSSIPSSARLKTSIKKPPTMFGPSLLLRMYIQASSTFNFHNRNATIMYPYHPCSTSFALRQMVLLTCSISTSEVGMGLLHKHGDDCLLHEGREIVEGRRIHQLCAWTKQCFLALDAVSNRVCRGEVGHQK